MALIINGRFLTRPVTGVERYGRMVLQVIARDRPDSRVIVPRSFDGEVDACGLQVVKHGTTRGHVWEQMELPRALERDDVLLSPANTGPLRAEQHVPVVHDLAFLHHPEWFNTRFATWYKLLMPRMLRRASHVITVSGTIAEEITRYYGVEKERLFVVPPFVLPSLTSTATVVDPERPYYLVVASLDPRKGLDRVMNWYTGLPDADFDLLIVGRSHRAFAEIEPPHGKGIQLLADVGDDRLAELYRGAIALVQPSYYEGFGLPVLEAFALGCPVVASYLPVFHEQFGEAPITADIGYTRSMMRAMVTLKNEAHRRELIAKGHACAARFTAERTARALNEALGPLLKN